MLIGPFVNIHSMINDFKLVQKEIQYYQSYLGASTPIVLAGDFNKTVLPGDRLGKASQCEGQHPRNNLGEILEEEHLCDVMQVESRKEFTRFRARLDRIYIRDPDVHLSPQDSVRIRMHVKRAFVVPYMYSDHDAVICKVKLESGQPKKCDFCSLWLTTCDTCEEFVHVHLSTNVSAECFKNAAFVTPSGACNKCELNRKHNICVNCGTFLPFQEYAQPLIRECIICKSKIHDKCTSFHFYGANQIVLCGRLDCGKKLLAN